MMHVMTVEDAARALLQAVHTRPRGVFNIPGKDILPLSQAIERTQRIGLAVPGPALAPLYGLRAAALRTDFRYDLNQLRFHFSGVLDGRRARVELGYEPTVGVDWSTLAATALL
jgi:UDP-glucose 4-epimerase